MTPDNALLARLTHVPILLAEGREHELLPMSSAVEAFLASPEAAASHAMSDDDFWAFDPDHWMARYRPYKVVNGILQIPVRGMLLNEFPYAFGGLATGYIYIAQALKRGLEDSDVKGIAFMVNSYGGTVSENFALVDKIYEGRSVKPIEAIVTDYAYSAAYNVAAAASHVTMTRSGGVGSIGVVMVHMEVSQALENMGVTVNIIRSKARKMEGNHYEKLSEKARAKFQGEADRLDKVFVSQVARNRGISEQSVHDTEATTFSYDEALKLQLVDEISEVEDAVMAFEGRSHQTGENDMANDPKAPTFTQADIDTAVAQATTTATAAGATAERERYTAILALDEAKGRPAATNLMIDLGLSAEDAKVKLAAMPVETKAEEPKPAPKAEEPQGAGAPKGMFTAAMGNTPNPEVGAEAKEGDEGNDKPDRAAKISNLLHAHGTAGYRRQKTA